MAKRGKTKRGLACVAPERRKEIARLGGKAAQALHRAHRWTREEAKAARALQLEKAREQEEFALRMKARLREGLGPSPGPGTGEEGS
jgi:hypothetical protein